MSLPNFAYAPTADSDSHKLQLADDTNVRVAGIFTSCFQNLGFDVSGNLVRLTGFAPLLRLESISAKLFVGFFDFIEAKSSDASSFAGF